MQKSVDDVAAFIKRETGASGLKLQKLAYYSQAWALVWFDRPLFGDRIEAWKKGPVTPALYEREKSHALVGNPANLGVDDVEVIRAVLSVYGDKPADWLSRLTHRETPWRQARGVLPPDAPSSNEIAQPSIRKYYGEVLWGQGRTFSVEYLRGLDLLVELPEDEVQMLLNSTAEMPAEEFLRWMETGDEDCGSPS